MSKTEGRDAQPLAVARQIIDSLTSGVLAVDATGHILTSNPAAENHLRSGSLQPGTALAAIPAAQPLADIFAEVQATGVPVSRREVIIASGDGQEIEIGLSANLLDGPDAFNGVIFLFTDMTERRSLERAAELNRQLAALGELTAGVVHELRTPVMVISGMAELLTRRLAQDNANVETARLIHTECGTLDKLISQFLGFARPFDLQAGKCAVEEIAERAVKLCAIKASEKNVPIQLAIATGLPPVVADSGKLVQVLVNLVNNALDAVAPDTGEVTVEAQREGDVIRFDVVDNGPGLSLQPDDDVFKPFFTMKEGGTGLGLSIVSRIVHAHHGKITAHNRPEGGAQFQVRIPVRPGDSA